MVQMWNEIKEQPQAVRNCFAENSSAVKELAAEIRKRNINSVYIAARGTSDHAGIYGKYIMECNVGVPVALAASSVFTLYNKSVNFKNCLVIGISQSGKAADVLEVLRDANKQGALTVSLTNFKDSPLALEASYHLFCAAGVEKSVAATKTFTTQMFLLAMLTAEWSGNEALKAQIATIPELLEKTFDIAGTIEQKAQRYRYMTDCFVLARGVNFSIAMEAALKMQETTYVKAKAFAISDFQHGPIAMVDKDTPVFVYAPNGPSYKDTSEIIDRLNQIGAEVIVISNNKEALEKAATAFEIPQTDNDALSPFMNVAVAQMFACSLSLAKGLNPDSPRGLSKVTITK